MFQTDPLLSFSIGCGLAAAAGDGLKTTNYRLVNKYFVFTSLYFSLLFVPVNIYMLWEHTGYKTMFYYDASIFGLWVSLSSHLTILTGIGGFLVGRHFVRMNQELSAYSTWLGTWTLALAAVTCHYDRLVYPGGIRDWTSGKQFTLPEFISSEIFKTHLLVIPLVTFPVFYAQIWWPKEEGNLTKARKAAITTHCVKTFTKQGLLVSLSFVILRLTHLTPIGWGWDRLLAISVGHLIFGILLLSPIFFMSTKYTVTAKIELRRGKGKVKPRTRLRRPRSMKQPTEDASVSTVDADEEMYEDDPGSLESNGHVVEGNEKTY